MLNTLGIAILAPLIVWSAIWKGIALWKCGRNKQLAWFIVLFIINTAGILEIIYLIFFRKDKKKKVVQKKKAKKIKTRKK